MLIAAVIGVLALTGPRPEQAASGAIRRFGGVCLQLERWSLFGWSVVGHSYSVADTRNGRWHPPTGDPACADVPERNYLIRMPFDDTTGIYRICGLADERPCTEFRRVPFTGSPGP